MEFASQHEEKWPCRSSSSWLWLLSSHVRLPVYLEAPTIVTRPSPLSTAYRNMTTQMGRRSTADRMWWVCAAPTGWISRAQVIAQCESDRQCDDSWKQH